MKNFFTYIIKIILVCILMLAVLDIVYTFAFENCIPRNKLQFTLKTNNKKYTNVFVGSSRVANHIDVKYLDSISGGKNLNLGVEGATYGDNLLMLKLFIENGNKMDRIFLQLDHFYEQNEMAAIANSDALPFIRNTIVKEHFKKYDTQFNAYYYYPFYRYQSADFKIGFREFFMSAINKKPRIDMNYGYIPKFEKSDLTVYERFPNTVTEKNVFVEEIIDLCMERKIKLILFCAPFCSYTKDFTYIHKLKIKFPLLNDYSTSIKDTDFSNCSHLNNNGAKIFTHLIFEKHLKNEY
ncbi:hypothetical protein [Flavobacterium sp.]|uniref:hypothetical protein n=1 Tax=Flavobacterium sp. TaxID=239 RepID=UPI002A80552A|nr:hypothetical protein [Flavobacterium sp.]